MSDNVIENEVEVMLENQSPEASKPAIHEVGQILIKMYSDGKSELSCSGIIKNKIDLVNVLLEMLRETINKILGFDA